MGELKDDAVGYRDVVGVLRELQAELVEHNALIDDALAKSGEALLQMDLRQLQRDRDRPPPLPPVRILTLMPCPHPPDPDQLPILFCVVIFLLVCAALFHLFEPR